MKLVLAPVLLPRTFCKGVSLTRKRFHLPSIEDSSTYLSLQVVPPLFLSLEAVRPLCVKGRPFLLSLDPPPSRPEILSIPLPSSQILPVSFFNGVRTPPLDLCFFIVPICRSRGFRRQDPFFFPSLEFSHPRLGFPPPPPLSFMPALRAHPLDQPPFRADVLLSAALLPTMEYLTFFPESCPFPCTSARSLCPLLNPGKSSMLPFLHFGSRRGSETPQMPELFVKDPVPCPRLRAHPGVPNCKDAFSFPLPSPFP